MISDTYHDDEHIKRETKMDSINLLLVDRVLPSFGQGGSQEMILECIMFTDNRCSIRTIAGTGYV